MEVRCVKIINTYTGKDEGLSNGWLTVGNIYLVISVIINLQNDQNSYIRVESDDDMKPVLVNILNCEFVERSIPANFGIYSYPDKKRVDLEPRAWQEYKSGRGQYGFWEDFFDDEYAAVDLYRKEAALIKDVPYVPLPKTNPSTRELQEIKRRQERDGLIPDQGLNKSLKPIALTSTDDWGQKKAL